MVTVTQKEYTMSDYKAGYDNIAILCDYAEDLLTTVESPDISDKNSYLELIEPLINEIADSSDILSEEFLLIAESKKSRTTNKASKKRIESTLRRIFTALGEYQQNLKSLSHQVKLNSVKVAAPIVDKIQKQLDTVLAVFFEFIQISLQSIMNKAELDALRARDSRIALMMHQYSLSQHSS